MAEMIGQVRIVIAAHSTDPLMHPGALAPVRRLKCRTGESFVDIERNRRCLVDPETRMIQDWHPVEWVPRQMARTSHLRFKIVKIEGHILVRQDEPHDVDKGADRKAVDGDFSHGEITPELRLVEIHGLQAPARNAIARTAPYTINPAPVTKAKPTRPV